MVQTSKKIALLHRYPKDRIKETNASFPYLQAKGIDVLTFKKFDRTSQWKKHLKSFLWIFYAPLLVLGKGYDVLYLDDSYPIYPIFVKLASPKSKIILRLGDLHLMYYTKGLTFKILHFFEMIGWHLSYQIICISNSMCDYVFTELRRFRFDRFGRCENDPWVTVIRDPVDPKDFPIQSINNNETVVMFHGVLTKNKNIDLLLAAAHRLPEVRFLIVGDGPDKKRLQNIAPQNVVFEGWVPFNKIPEYINSCSAGVALRSDNPGNEYVVTSPYLQYGIMGKTCLVTRRKVFEDYFWQFSNVYELVELLRPLLENPDFAKEEGKKLRENILKYHDAETIAGYIWDILSR